MNLVESRELNILDVVFKEKTNKVEFSESQRKKVLEFGKEYWDDPTFPGCRGYHYDGRWKEPAEKLVEFYKLEDKAKILDLCCGKGYLLYELQQINPNFELRGVDISEYAIENAKAEVKSAISQGSIDSLPFENQSFDLVLCLNSLYILEFESCVKSLKEIERVGKRKFIQVNSYRNEHEQKNLVTWDASARVIKSTSEWQALFNEVGYTGEYYWTIFL